MVCEKKPEPIYDLNVVWLLFEGWGNSYYQDSKKILRKS
jgi:hypothetical protein